MPQHEDKKWFILSEGQVQGPFFKIEIEEKMTQLKSTLIWGRGLSDWLTPEKWKKRLLEQEKMLQNAKVHMDRLWRVRVRDQEYEPLLYSKMMDFLKTIPDMGEVLIWTEGYSEWKEVYQIHKIMDELGVSRRTHPRVPIMGSVYCEGVSGNFTAKILSISEGGLGITEAHNVKIGEKFKVLLKSPHLTSAIHATIEVVFSGADSYAGAKFISIHPESKGIIIEYIKKYSQAEKTQ